MMQSILAFEEVRKVDLANYDWIIPEKLFSSLGLQMR